MQRVENSAKFYASNNFLISFCKKNRAKKMYHELGHFHFEVIYLFPV